MTLQDELQSILAGSGGKAKVVALADLSRRALALDDLPLAIVAKMREMTESRSLGMQQYTVVACAELIEIWHQVVARDIPLTHDVRHKLLHGLRNGAGAAMDLPEIPLSTVRDLVTEIYAALERFGAGPYAAWSTEARLAYIEGDRALLEQRLVKLAETASVRNALYDYADCPGCTLQDVVQFMPRETPIEELEVAVAPLLSKSPFPQDREIAKLVREVYGADRMCGNARKWYPRFMARAYARAGVIAKARRLSKRMLDENDEQDPEGVARVHTAALEVAYASNRPDEMELHLATIERAVAEGVEDPYELRETHEIACRVARDLDRIADAERHRAAALALARRIDARLPTPRHERETIALLESPPPERPRRRRAPRSAGTDP